ncbi:trypsin-like peptidase domain-containing protein [Nitriliruptoraceae bacterium ZYF776]|nr:trypsin-like peptidase domain-containing protein [Profundirhabdus halotolerans]
MSSPGAGGGRGWRVRLFGDRDRLGWWLLPVFVAVGLAGAVLAGSLAVVFASQRVDRLTRETAAARADLATAVDDVQDAAEDALSSIREEVDAVRDGLSTELPFDDAAAAGIVHLDVDTEVTAEVDDAPPPPDADAEPDGAEAPPPPIPVRRRASGFVVARDGDDAFVVTTFALLADPRSDDVPLDVAVRVRVAAGETTARLHSWDEARDLLLLRAPLGEVTPLPWRPADAPLSGGERVVAVGLTPALGPVRVGGTVAASEAAGLVTDVPALELLAGGPVVDAEGRVVGVGSVAYRPFGGDPVAVPIRQLCERLLSRCPA